MKRTHQQWIDCNPKTMAHDMSDNAKQFAFEDAKADILYLAQENLMMKDFLSRIAYPRRGSKSEQMTLCEFAADIQAKWTSADLEHL